jgi:hypothetical protein
MRQFLCKHWGNFTRGNFYYIQVLYSQFVFEILAYLDESKMRESRNKLRITYKYYLRYGPELKKDQMYHRQFGGLQKPKICNYR